MSVMSSVVEVYICGYILTAHSVFGCTDTFLLVVNDICTDKYSL